MKQNLVLPILAIVAVSLLANTSPLFAQQMMTLKFDPDSTFIIPELGAAITQTKDTLTVNMMLPGQPSGEYADVDVKKGDMVLSVNGKSVKSAKKLRAAYDALQVGDTIKIAIMRNGVGKTISFKKADESKLPGRKIIRRSVGGEGVKTETGGK